MRIATISQPRYLPYLGYFHRIACSDVFIVLDTVQFKPREWDRRNRVRAGQNLRWVWLTVPVKRIPRDTVIGEVRIDNSQNWQEKHLRTLKSSYGKAPYFDLYIPGLEQFYKTRYELIRDLNLAMTRFFCGCLGILPEIVLASNLRPAGRSSELLISLCRSVGADTYWSGAEGRAYIAAEKFAQANISLMFQDYRHPVYEQLHGKPFLPYMGIVDLLFNCGPGSMDVLLAGNDLPRALGSVSISGDQPGPPDTSCATCPVDTVCLEASSQIAEGEGRICVSRLRRSSRPG